MKVWLGSFVVLFALAELWQWVRGMAVPFPVFVVAGTLLAIATNWDKRAAAPFSWWHDPELEERPPGRSPTAAVVPNTAAISIAESPLLTMTEGPTIAPGSAPPLAMPTTQADAAIPAEPLPSERRPSRWQADHQREALQREALQREALQREALQREALQGQSSQGQSPQGQSSQGQLSQGDRSVPATPTLPPIHRPTPPPPVQRRSPVLPVLPPRPGQPRRTPPAA